MKKIITTHKNTDFDALASLVAGTLLYPDAVPILPRQINPNVKSFLSIHKDIFEFPRADQLDLNAVQHLIVVDTNAWGRLDRPASTAGTLAARHPITNGHGLTHETPKVRQLLTSRTGMSDGQPPTVGRRRRQTSRSRP